MRSFMLVFLIALSITVVSTPWIRRLAVATGFVDAPAARKMHTNPMPLMGGVAIFAGAILAIVFIFREEFPRSVVGPLIAGTLVAVVGLMDDRRHLPPWLRLGAHFVAFLVLLYFGVQVRLPVPA